MGGFFASHFLRSHVGILAETLSIMQKYRIYYRLQFALLSAAILIFGLVGSLSPVEKLMVLLPFFISEIFLVHHTSNIPPEKIFYRKSCAMAIVDSIFVLGFCAYIIVLLLQFFYEINTKHLDITFIFLLVYTLARKFHIYKNFSYEK